MASMNASGAACESCFDDDSPASPRHWHGVGHVILLDEYLVWSYTAFVYPSIHQAYTQHSCTTQ